MRARRVAILSQLERGLELQPTSTGRARTCRGLLSRRLPSWSLAERCRQRSRHLAPQCRPRPPAWTGRSSRCRFLARAVPGRLTEPGRRKAPRATRSYVPSPSSLVLGPASRMAARRCPPFRPAHPRYPAKHFIHDRRARRAACFGRGASAPSKPSSRSGKLVNMPSTPSVMRLDIAAVALTV